jgi:hypothetical protein
MSNEYRIRLAPKNEGVEYRDDNSTYRFNAQLRHGVWTVETPPSSEGAAPTPAEVDVVQHRVRAFLEEIRWFGVFPRRYRVAFVPAPATVSTHAPYRIVFTTGKTAVAYQDESGEYRFEVSCRDRTWTVRLPPLTPDGEARFMTDEDRGRILPRIESFLQRGLQFGVIPAEYEVRYFDTAIH